MMSNGNFYGSSPFSESTELLALEPKILPFANPQHDEFIDWLIKNNLKSGRKIDQKYYSVRWLTKVQKSKLNEPMLTLTSIYGLSEPLTGEFRYIGTTIRSLKVRLQGHICASKESRRDRNHNAIWIRSLLAQGLKPNIQLLETVGGDGREAEIKWILYGRHKGWNLTNSWGREPIRDARHKADFDKYKKLFKMSNLT